MRIITISREFGSGGRELGKRLAALLGYDYYDKEIILTIAKNKNLSETYVAALLENHGWKNIPLTFRSSFSAAAPSMQTALLIEQKTVIEEIADAGKDCIIIGRSADTLLKRYHPFNIFVCADVEAKVARCMQRASESEGLTQREIQQKMRSIDKGRAKVRELIGGEAWGSRTAYHLTVNTTQWNIKDLTPAVKEFADRWFGRTL